MDIEEEQEIHCVVIRSMGIDVEGLKSDSYNRNILKGKRKSAVSFQKSEIEIYQGQTNGGP